MVVGELHAWSGRWFVCGLRLLCQSRSIRLRNARELSTNEQSGAKVRQ